ncbi:hypothetical protein [Cupriavidus basilensis]|nr:hypothetical protein [Cupriavidus basilensis]
MPEQAIVRNVLSLAFDPSVPRVIAGIFGELLAQVVAGEWVDQL